MSMTPDPPGSWRLAFRRGPFAKAVAIAALALATASNPSAGTAAAAAKTKSAAPAPADARAAMFNGTWWKDGPTLRFSAEPPLLPAAKAKFDALKPQDDPGARCLPGGLGRFMISPQGFQSVVLGNQMLLVNEGGGVRRVWLDHKQHDPDWDPGYMGESVIRWDGRVMVVDTVNFKDNMTMDSWGHPMSAQTHLVEHWKLLSPQKLQIEYTWSDPVNYSKPFSSTFTYSRHDDYRQGEYSCTENNRNNPDDPSLPKDWHSTDAPAGYQERPAKQGA